jgi:hypothetical protein
VTEMKNRYVAAVLSSIPETRRSDVDRELRAAIDDAIEARVEQGEPPSAAETTVLTDLGDPALLAADYSDRPLYLIGPRFYLPWLRLMRKLLAVIPLLAGVVAAVVRLVTGEGLVEALLGGVWTGLIAAANVVVWTTVGFVLAERDDAAAADLQPLTKRAQWSLDRLPMVPDRQFHSGEVIGSMVVIAVLFSVVFSLQNVALPFVDPVVWDRGIPVLLGLLGFSFLLELAKLSVGKWSYPLASANAAVNLGFAAWWVWALVGGLIDPDDLAAYDSLTISAWVTVAIIVAMCLWDAYRGFAGVRRADT